MRYCLSEQVTICKFDDELRKVVLISLPADALFRYGRFVNVLNS